ncbi:conserved hypothetical protein, partial [Ricinus communis]
MNRHGDGGNKNDAHPRQGKLDQRPQGLVDRCRARHSVRTGRLGQRLPLHAGTGIPRAESERDGPGAGRWRRRAVGVEHDQPLPGRALRRRTPAAGRRACPREGRAVDGLAGDGIEQCVALRVHGPAAGQSGTPGP